MNAIHISNVDMSLRCENYKPCMNPFLAIKKVKIPSYRFWDEFDN